MSSMEKSTVILGAGIIGVSTAYYLAQADPSLASSIHLVDSSPELFASASGKAGGFLAADWFGPTVAPLGALSFSLHKSLAEKHNGREGWGYSTSTGASLAHSPYPVRADGRRKRGDDWLRDGSSRAEVAGESDENGNVNKDKLEAMHRFEEGNGPAWLTRQNGDEFEVLGKGETVAQVDPLRLCHFLLSECKALGVQIHNPFSATSISKTSSGTLSSIHLRNSTSSDELDIPCTHILLAAGAWTPRIFSTLFPSSPLSIPISALAGHSIVIRSPRWTADHETSGCHAVFTTTSSGFSPELISRIGGEIYVAGLNSTTIPLPDIATEAMIDKHAIEELKRTGQRLCGLQEGEQDLEVLREGLCFRPVTARGTPVLGRLEMGELGFEEGEGGVFLAAGHGPWGISLSLGTGLVMSEIMRGKETSADIGRLGL